MFSATFLKYLKVTKYSPIKRIKNFFLIFIDCFQKLICFHFICFFFCWFSITFASKFGNPLKVELKRRVFLGMNRLNSDGWMEQGLVFHNKQWVPVGWDCMWRGGGLIYARIFGFYLLYWWLAPEILGIIFWNNPFLNMYLIGGDPFFISLLKKGQSDILPPFIPKNDIAI